MEPKIPTEFKCPRCEMPMSDPEPIDVYDRVEDGAFNAVLMYVCKAGSYVSPKLRWWHVMFSWFAPADVWVACAHVALALVDLVE